MYVLKHSHPIINALIRLTTLSRLELVMSLVIMAVLHLTIYHIIINK